jgi:PIN like domain
MAQKAIAADQVGNSNTSSGSGKASVNESPTELWTLEDVFPDAGQLLSPSERVSAANADVLVALDTNALLLPFRVGKQELPQINDVYEKLISAGRLFVPARVIREFIKNRDGRLAEIAKGLRDKGSAVGGGGVDIPPLLEGLQETQAVADAAAELKRAGKTYLNATSKLVDLIRAWRGNDPVTAIYHKLFRGDVIIDVDETREDIEREWQTRLKRRIPPGYKDASKQDTGIGDFMIWLVILKLGKTRGKDLIFVTGEEKADWFVRADNEGIYPRPELVDEYRRVSNGRHLQLSKLADVLSDMKVPDAVVQEVREAETAANTAVQAATTFNIGLSEPVIVSSRHRSVFGGDVSFDYSTNDGLVVVGNDNARFNLRFSKASDTSIHIYRGLGTPLITRAKNVKPGEITWFDRFDSSSRAYTIRLEELFLAKNDLGQILAGRIKHISDDSRGAFHDEVTFEYSIFGPGESIVAP